MRQFSGTVATHKNQIFRFCPREYIHNICDEVAMQRFTTVHNGFATIHNGSHATVKRVPVISWIGDVNRCDPTEIYCTAQVNRKKQNLRKQ